MACRAESYKVVHLVVAQRTPKSLMVYLQSYATTAKIEISNRLYRELVCKAFDTHHQSVAADEILASIRPTQLAEALHNFTPGRLINYVHDSSDGFEKAR